jgi:hypothetical protein
VRQALADWAFFTRFVHRMINMPLFYTEDPPVSRYIFHR